MSRATPDGGTRPNRRPIVYTPRETDVRNYPKNVGEYLYQGVFGDPNSKWGPFSRHVRAAKKEGRWTEWSLRDIVNAEPDDSDIDPDEDEIPMRGGNSRNRSKKGGRGYRVVDELLRDIRPAHVDFEALIERESHPHDYDDNFYKLHYNNLYVRTVEFVGKWFDGNVNLDGFGESDRIWASNLTPQFVEYARLVAHEDRGNGGWPVILNDPAQRRWLIVGILGQIMEKKIFNELLFGADEFIADELERQDLQWIEKEGYDRKAARAITARYAVDSRLLPGEFWAQVDDLTAKTMKIFLPLLNVFKEVFPGPAKTGYSQEIFLQELHAIISYAGLIQVCMAVSPSIFHFLSATPGARMDYAQEHQSDMQLYRESKELYEDADKGWRAYVDAATKGGRAKNRSGEPVQVPKDESERRLMEYHRIRGAKVKFAVFPKVTRYKPENKGKGVSDIFDHDNGSFFEDVQSNVEGQKIVDISHCMVVYYQGLIYPAEDVIEATTLHQHLDSLAKQPTNLVDFLKFLILAVSSVARRGFWHFLVVGLTLGFLSSLALGINFIRYLISYWLIPVAWFSMCFYFVARPYFARSDYQTGLLILAIPVAVVYSWGFYHTYTGVKPPVRDPSEAFEIFRQVSNEISKHIRDNLKQGGVGGR